MHLDSGVLYLYKYFLCAALPFLKPRLVHLWLEFQTAVIIISNLSKLPINVSSDTRTAVSCE